MTHPTASVVSLLEQKLKVFDDFLFVTLMLKTALEKEETAAVNRLIEKRTALISVINGVDRQIQFLRSRMTVEQRSDMVRLMKDMMLDLNEKLENITKANQSCENGVFLKCESLRKELKNMHRQEAGVHGYGMRGQTTPKFLSIQI